MDIWTEKSGKHDDPDMAHSVSVEELAEDDNMFTDTELYEQILHDLLGRSATLPGLFKGFASRLRYDTDYPIRRNIITFINEHSGYVTRSLCWDHRRKLGHLNFIMPS